MKGFVLQTPGKKRAAPGRFRGAQAPSTEYECPPTPRHTRDSAVEREFAQRGVRTVLAIKPLEAEGGLTKAEYPILTFDPSSRALVTTAPPTTTPGDSIPEHSFDSRYFDHVYQGPTLRVNLKRELQPIVDSVVGGRSAAIVAYGQTGSGKTFLMEGAPSSADRAAWGLAPHAIYKVLQAVQRSSDKKFLVSVSCLEVYNEVVKDLLVPPTRGPPGAGLQLKLNADGYYDVPEATSTPVSSVTQALALLRAAATRRAQGATAMNARSSRSFADVILTVESIDGGGRGACCARLHLVDLAGSERQAQTGAEGGRLKESSAINLALLALRKVVQARSAAASTRPPYTDSKVTKILKDALSGDAALLVVCCLSASPANYQDSLGTLKFAASCRSLTAKPIVRRVSVAQSRIAGLSVAVERIRAAEQAMAAERLIRLESRAVAQEIELQVAEARLSEARGQIQAGANLAAAAQAASEELLAHCAAVVDELVAGQGAASEAAAGLLARHVLPQLDFCLDNPQMIAHVSPSALLRFAKALLQVNFAAAHSAAAPLARLFTRLLEPEVTSPSRCVTGASFRQLAGAGCASVLRRTWPGLLTYCSKLVDAETVDGASEPLPPFVLGNLESVLRAIARVVKTVGEHGAAGVEAQEALEVSKRVVGALEGRENCAMRARFLGLFRTIVADVTSRQKERLFDLGSPVGDSSPSSPGSWLTPSRSRVKAQSPRGEVQPGAMSGLAGAERDRLEVRGMAASMDEEMLDLATLEGQTENRTAGNHREKESQTAEDGSRDAVPGEVSDGRGPRSKNATQAEVRTENRPDMRSVGATGQAQPPSNSVRQPSEYGTDIQVEDFVRTAEPVCTGQERVCTAEVGGELLLGEEVEGSPGSWLTPSYFKPKVLARTSKLGGGRVGFCGGERKAVSLDAVIPDAATTEDGKARQVKIRDATEGEKRPVTRAGNRDPSREGSENLSVDVFDSNDVRSKETGVAQAKRPALGETAHAQGVGTGGKTYPRLLISGEWRTPEYMKAKGTVSHKVKTCARPAAGPRTPAVRANAAAWTPADAAVAATMASVKKVLFSEKEEGTRGEFGLARLVVGGAKGKLSGFGGSEMEGLEILGAGEGSKLSHETNPAVNVVTDEKGSVLREPVSKKLPKLVGGLGGGLEPRQVLSPLKQSGVRPVAAWRSSPFGSQYAGKENAPADPSSHSKPPQTQVPVTSPFALRQSMLTSPSILQQSLLKSPRPAVRSFGPFPTSAVRPPRAMLGKGEPARISGTPAGSSVPVKWTDERNGNGIETGNGDAFAHLRGQLQSLLLSGETRGKEIPRKIDAALVPGKAARGGREEEKLKLTGRSEAEMRTPIAGRNGGATSFLSPALLWTPSQGPSPSLDSLRERLAGMARQ